MKYLSNKEGFTLIEIIVVVAIIAILAGIMTPMIMKNIDDAKISRAYEECKNIGEGVANMYRDTGVWPDCVSCGTTYTPGAVNILHGAGAVPIALGNWGQLPLAAGASTILTSYFYRNFLVNAPDGAAAYAAVSDYPQGTTNPYPTPAWRGPYILRDLPDPWGTRYYINVGVWDQVIPAVPAANPTQGAPCPIYVVSAGPNKSFYAAATAPNDTNVIAAGGATAGMIINGAGVASLTVLGDDVGYRIR